MIFFVGASTGLPRHPRPSSDAGRQRHWSYLRHDIAASSGTRDFARQIPVGKVDQRSVVDKCNSASVVTGFCASKSRSQPSYAAPPVVNRRLCRQHFFTIVQNRQMCQGGIWLRGCPRVKAIGYLEEWVQPVPCSANSGRRARSPAKMVHWTSGGSDAGSVGKRGSNDLPVAPAHPARPGRAFAPKNGSLDHFWGLTPS